MLKKMLEIIIGTTDDERQWLFNFTFIRFLLPC